METEPPGRDEEEEDKEAVLPERLENNKYFEEMIILSPEEYERFRRERDDSPNQRGAGKLDRKRGIEEASTHFDKRSLYVDRDTEIQKKKHNI